MEVYFSKTYKGKIRNFYNNRTDLLIGKELNRLQVGNFPFTLNGVWDEITKFENLSLIPDGVTFIDGREVEFQSISVFYDNDQVITHTQGELDCQVTVRHQTMQFDVVNITGKYICIKFYDYIITLDLEELQSRDIYCQFYL